MFIDLTLLQIIHSAIRDLTAFPSFCQAWEREKDVEATASDVRRSGAERGIKRPHTFSSSCYRVGALARQYPALPLIYGGALAAEWAVSTPTRGTGVIDGLDVAYPR